MQTLTLIVPFEIPESQEDVFLKQWHDVAQPLRHAPGLLFARLYKVDTDLEEYLVRELDFHWLRARPNARARFRFMTLVAWESRAHDEAAIRSSRRMRRIAFPGYGGYYRQAFGDTGPKEDVLESKKPTTMQTFTLIVPFEVPEGQEDVFLKQWHDVVDGMERPEGALGPGLYEEDIEASEHLLSGEQAQSGEKSDAQARFRFINVAQWATLSHYEAVIRSRRQVKPIAFPGHGAYYRMVAEYTQE
jgi:heme-degrading monooxygenase HmoA